MLATKAIIQIRTPLLDWRDLCIASTLVQYKSYGTKFRALGKELENVTGICLASRIGFGLREWRPQPLLILLLLTIQTQSTFPKDRIFGLLALTEESTRKYYSPSGPLDNPKYNMSMRELYTDVPLYLLRQDRSETNDPYGLAILNFVKHCPIEEGEQEKRNIDDGG